MGKPLGARSMGTGVAGRVLALPAVFALALSLGGCFAAIGTPEHTASLPEPPKESAHAPVQREHQRILAAYSGVYDDPKLEALVRQAVEKLVAASERPDQRYKITILNSP